MTTNLNITIDTELKKQAEEAEKKEYDLALTNELKAELDNFIDNRDVTQYLPVEDVLAHWDLAVGEV